jgi:hypothetical protein
VSRSHPVGSLPSTEGSHQRTPLRQARPGTDRSSSMPIAIHTRWLTIKVPVAHPGGWDESGFREDRRHGSLAGLSAGRASGKIHARRMLKTGRSNDVKAVAAFMPPLRSHSVFPPTRSRPRFSPQEPDVEGDRAAIRCGRSRRAVSIQKGGRGWHPGCRARILAAPIAGEDRSGASIGRGTSLPGLAPVCPFCRDDTYRPKLARARTIHSL